MVLVLAAGCGREEVKVYRVPKEPAPPATMPAGHPDVGAPAPQLTWTTPAGWTEVPPGSMRVASFKADGADVSVIPLPGAAGGDFSNVNRWRGQVGLPAVSEEEIPKLAETVTVAGQPAALYDQVGESSRILAVIHHRAGMAWFFKMTGPPQVVAAQKAAFIQFVQEVKY